MLIDLCCCYFRVFFEKCSASEVLHSTLERFLILFFDIWWFCYFHNILSSLCCVMSHMYHMATSRDHLSKLCRQIEHWAVVVPVTQAEAASSAPHITGAYNLLLLRNNTTTFTHSSLLGPWKQIQLFFTTIDTHIIVEWFVGMCEISESSPRWCFIQSMFTRLDKHE